MDRHDRAVAGAGHRRLSREGRTLKYGILPRGDRTLVKAGTPGERARMPAAVDASGTIIDSAPAAPTTAIDKARSVENVLKQQESKRSGGY
jgi:hypothetical protein